MKTIQTAAEIRLHSVVDASYRIEGLCDRILVYEETAFKQCLGLEFYNTLIEDLNNIPSDTEEWDESKDYSIDNYVVYHELIYISIISNNKNKVPGVDESWSLIRKFKTNCYNELYDRYLKVYLSNYAVHNDLTFNTAQFGNKGIVITKSDKSGQERVSLELMYQWRRDAKKLYDDTLELIKIWIEKNKSSCNFSKVAFLNNDCDSESCSDTEERIAW